MKFLVRSVLMAVMVASAMADHPSHNHHHQPHHHGHQPKPAHHHKPSHGYCDPQKAPPCAGNGSTYCLADPDYPTYEIKGAISKDYLVAKKYADVADQSADSLVEGLSKERESSFDYSYYTGASKGPSPYDLSHWSGPEGYICPSSVAYTTPLRAQNVEGHWRVIVNQVHYYSQTARLETCLHPGSACRALPPCYESKCVQKFVYHRMLSYDLCDPYKGLFVDIYKLPSACSCHV